METQILQLASDHFSLKEEEDNNKENIPPFSAQSSAPVLPFPHPRKPLQDITRLIAAATQNGIQQSSVAGARPHVDLGVHACSKKCSKKRKPVFLSSGGRAISNHMTRQRHEKPILRKGFR